MNITKKTSPESEIIRINYLNKNEKILLVFFVFIYLLLFFFTIRNSELIKTLLVVAIFIFIIYISTLGRKRMKIVLTSDEITINNEKYSKTAIERLQIMSYQEVLEFTDVKKKHENEKFLVLVFKDSQKIIIYIEQEELVKPEYDYLLEKIKVAN